jgi:hypothetical protein
MATERRENPRFSMMLECAINIDNRGYRRCKTRDISQDGVFVVTGVTSIAHNPAVQLAVKTTIEGHSEVHQYRALIRHVSRDGVGLFFSQPDAPGARSLVDLVMTAGRL